ncbi:MAG TPA: hypothetical protein VFE47_00120 [Tepidisphaeraceae bacterium]|nr:hypothetical protein [Tepidisphaeraceae bacterium]
MRVQHARGWLILLLACAMLGGIRGVLEKGRRQDEINRAKNQALHRILRDEMELEAGPFASAKLLKMAAKIPGAGLADIPGGRFGPQYRGWVLRLHFSPRPADNSYPESIASGEILPPPTMQIRGEPTSLWWTVEYLRAAILLLAMVAWSAGIILIMSVRGVRHQVSRWCLAAALLTMFAAALACDFQWKVRLLGQSRWFVIGAAMAFVALVLRLIPARRQVENGRCHGCRYDLTGNISGVCPECGTPTARHLREIRLAEVSPVADRLVNLVATEPEENESEQYAADDYAA